MRQFGGGFRPTGAFRMISGLRRDCGRAEREAGALLRRIARLQSAGRPAVEIWQATAEAALTVTRSRTAGVAIRRDSGRVLEFVAAAGDACDALAGLRI